MSDQLAAALRARNLLIERNDTLLTQIEFRPYELWILAEAIRLGLEHPSFHLISAGFTSPDIWDIARQLWAECHARIADLDEQLAAVMQQP